MADPGRPAPPSGIRHHRRFALTDVTFEGAPVGGATVDAWQDADGASRWSARVVMSPAGVASRGVLGGRTRDGRVLRGVVILVGHGPAIRSRGPVLIEWGGEGPLLPVDDAGKADAG